MNEEILMSEDAEPKTVRVLFIDDEFIEFRALKKKVANVVDPPIDMEYAQSIGDAIEKVTAAAFDLVLLDNRLLPNEDFRETVPALRGIGYTGPIGVISSDISGGYFQEFQDYGVDFRLGKDEIDARTLQYIIREYVRYEMPDFWRDDYTI